MGRRRGSLSPRILFLALGVRGEAGWLKPNVSDCFCQMKAFTRVANDSFGILFSHESNSFEGIPIPHFVPPVMESVIRDPASEEFYAAIYKPLDQPNVLILAALQLLPAV